MTVTNVVTDLDARTLTLTAEYDAGVEQVWQLWANPRLLERWWGPPTHPSTFTRHEFQPNGIVGYHMTGPEGETYPGWWRIIELDEPAAIVFEDGFGEPGSESDLPVTSTRVTIEAIGDGRTRMVICGTAPTREALEQLIEMGMQEGLAQAVGQIDAILAEGAVRA